MPIPFKESCSTHNGKGNQAQFNHLLTTIQNSLGKVYMAYTAQCSSQNTLQEDKLYFQHKLASGRALSFIGRCQVRKDELLTLPEFSEWLFDRDASMRIPSGHDSSEYLFGWICKHIEKADRDIQSGLHQALCKIRTSHLQGSIGFILTEGTTLYAYSNFTDYSKTYNIFFQKRIAASDRVAYQLRGGTGEADKGWNLLTEHCLHCFTLEGKHTVLYNIDSHQYQDLRFSPGYIWTNLANSL